MENCRQALTEFELKYTVSFALELEQLFEEKSAATGESAAAANAGNKGRVSWRNSKKAKPSAPTVPQAPSADRYGMQHRGGISGRSMVSNSSSTGSGSTRSNDRGRWRRGSEEADGKPVKTISDEADSVKKMRRQTNYRECSRHFIRYFSDAGTIRLLVTCFF